LDFGLWKNGAVFERLLVGRVWPLNLHIIQDIPEDLLNCSIADMVDDGGQWMWETFAHLLPFQVVMILVGYNPPTSYMGGDKAY
jgi:hypothetical protein